MGISVEERGEVAVSVKGGLAQPFGEKIGNHTLMPRQPKIQGLEKNV